MFKLFQLAILIIAGIAVFGNSIYQWLKTGRGGFRLPSLREPVSFIVDIVFWVGVVGWVAIGILWYFQPDFIESIFPLFDPRYEPLQYIGVLLGLTGIIYITTGIFSLGSSFRTSIDYEEQTRLVTTGIYRFCRNPMALGLILSGWSMVFLVQTIPALLVTALLQVTNRMRVHYEEKRLREILGDEFEEFCSKVSRFFPRPGR